MPVNRVRLAATVALCLAFPANSSAQGFPGPAATAATGSAGRCTVREVGRDSLILGGRRLYVAPHAFHANDAGELFIASDINALFEQDSAGAWRHSVMDSVLGVVVSPGGTARLIHAPVPNRLLGAVRVAPDAEGSWTVVYGERVMWEGTRADKQPGKIRRLWSGIVRGTELTMLDTLPHPEGWEFTSGPSVIARAGDTLALAVIVRKTGELRRTLVYERREGRWAYESILTRFGMYATPAYSPLSGLVLTTVESDPYTPEDNGNSLFVWQRRPEWTRTRRVISSLQQEVHRPALRFKEDGHGSLSWTARVALEERNVWKLFAMSGAVAESNGPMVTLESDANFYTDVLPLPLDSRTDIWILTSEDQPGRPSEIRVVNGEGHLLHRQANPYVAGISSLKTAQGEYVVAGAVHDADEMHFTTVLLRFQVECAGRFHQP